MKRRRAADLIVSGWGGGGGRKISQRENHPEHVEQHTDRQMVDAAKKQRFYLSYGGRGSGSSTAYVYN